MPQLSIHTATPLFSNTACAMHAFKDRRNKIVFSSLHDYFEPVDAQGFSVKYVVDGTEIYTLNHEQHVVTGNTYLLCNSAQSGFVEIESRNNVKGICISIAPEIITEAVASLLQPDTMIADAELGSFFLSPDFPENRYDASSTCTGALLQLLATDAASQKLSRQDLHPGLFYELATGIIRDQLPVFKQLQAIPAIKRATKKTLYRHLQRGREFMDSCFINSPDVARIAREACMSEYHFFRMFKLVMGITPHQYLLQKRLQLGKELLQQHNSVAETALAAGFADIYSFSKAFKKQFGHSPSLVVKNSRI